jgi:hypothetical protein
MMATFSFAGIFVENALDAAAFEEEAARTEMEEDCFARWLATVEMRTAGRDKVAGDMMRKRELRVGRGRWTVEGEWV